MVRRAEADGIKEAKLRSVEIVLAVAHCYLRLGLVGKENSIH
jgi:hypothetical protein